MCSIFNSNFIVLCIFLRCILVTSDLPLPSVNLSNYRLSTADEVHWENATTIIIPEYFEALEFECNSSYPTEWVLSFNPLEDDSFKEMPRVLKQRDMLITENGSVYSFTSRIIFQFKYPSKIQTFTCQSVRELNLKRITAVTTTRYSANAYITNISAANDYLQTENCYGSNTDCSMSIYLDLEKKKYDCIIRGTFPPNQLILYSCKNPDECKSILVSNTDRCKDTMSPKCDKPTCRSFSPKIEPGVIICKNGANSVAVKYAVRVTSYSNNRPVTKLELYKDKSPPENYLSISYYNDTVYDGQSINFVCNGSMYIFSKGFQWGFTQNGGKEVYMDDNKSAEVVENIYHTYVVRKAVTFNTSLTNDVTGVICFAPIWNSFNSARAIAPIQIKSSAKPTIWTPASNYSASSGTLIMNCSYSGIPTPVISWYIWRRKVTVSDEYFKIENKENLSQFIIFNVETLKKEGRAILRLTCEAENFLGVDERRFVVSYKDPAEYSERRGGLTNDVLTIIVVAMLFVIILIVCLGWVYINYIRKKNLHYITRDIQYFLEGNPNIVVKDDDTCSMAIKQPYRTEYEIPLDNVYMDRQSPLGSGVFGMVLRGSAVGGRCSQNTAVAIKTLKSNVEPSYFRNLMMELKVMIHVGEHDNIVNLLGCCTQKIYEMELYIIMEYCPNGELEKYMRTRRQEFVNQSKDGRISKDLLRQARKRSNKQSNSLCTTDLVMWSYQIACGMEYLAGKKVIHGDLATRNILLNERLTAKICDFGLSRQLYQYSQYVKKHQTPLPWRWMAVESLRDLEFSTESDVWSFAVTLWEIYSLAEVPYPGLVWNTDFLKSLIAGVRLHQPIYCPDEVEMFTPCNFYKLMQECWEIKPTLRPTFSLIRINLKGVMNSNSFMPDIPEEV